MMLSSTKIRRGTIPAAAIILAAAMMSNAAAQSVVKIGAPTVRDANVIWMNTFKEVFEKAGQGKYRVDTFPGGQLGSMSRSLDAVMLGTIEVTITIPEFMGGLDKRFGAISMPGIFDSTTHAYRTVQDPQFQKAYWTLAEPKGIMFLGMYCPTDTNYAFRPKVTSLADFRGKKIRTFPSAIETATLGVLGATPAPMSLDEVLTGLQRGVIDGSKSGMTVFVGFKYQSTAPYAVRTNETMICVPAAASKTWFDRLPVALQKSAVEAGRLADEKAQGYALRDNEQSYVKWVEGGGTLTSLTSKQRADFLKRLAVVEEVALKEAPDVREMFHLIKRVAERHRK